MNKQTKAKTKQTKREKYQKSAKSKNNHSSPLSKHSWCDLNNKGNLLIVHDMCPRPKCKCQEQITFKPNQFELEGVGFKNTMKKTFKGSQKACDYFLKPAVNTFEPFNGMAVGEKSKNLQVAQATTNILNNVSRGKILSLTDMHGNGLELKLM